MRFIFYRALHILALWLYCNVQNLAKHLLHYRENGFRSNKTNSVLHVICLHLLNYCFMLFGNCSSFSNFYNKLICIHACLILPIISCRKATAMWNESTKTWIVAASKWQIFFIVFYHFKTQLEAQQAMLGLIQRILCTFGL